MLALVKIICFVCVCVCVCVSLLSGLLQQAQAEQEEEFISNTLLKKINALKKEKEALAMNYEQEEEYLTNDLSRKLAQVCNLPGRDSFMYLHHTWSHLCCDNVLVHSSVHVHQSVLCPLLLYTHAHTVCVCVVIYSMLDPSDLVVVLSAAL